MTKKEFEELKKKGLEVSDIYVYVFRKPIPKIMLFDDQEYLDKLMETAILRGTRLTNEDFETMPPYDNVTNNTKGKKFSKFKKE